jgi:hypothetical protein
LIFSEAFGVFKMVSVMFSSLYQCGQGVGCWGVEYQSVEVSKYCGVKVSGCAVKIWAWFVGEFRLLLDFETFKAKCLTVSTSSDSQKG